jgi:hypothetical protein
VKIGTAFSQYLKHEDLGGRNVLVTIERVEIEEIKSETGKEQKPVVYFLGKGKGLILNRTNADSIASILGTDETDDWQGQQVVLYTDHKIQFGSKRVSGIRITKVPKAAPSRPVRPVEPEPEDDGGAREAIAETFQADDSDVPF